MSDMDASGISVAVNRGTRSPRTRSWVVPLGGGRIEDEDVTIEVSPNVEMPEDRWRDYEAIEALADTVESNGGFMWQGDDVAVGDEILVGRDAMRLLTVLWKRAGEREGDGDSLDRARKQGEEAARRAVRAELKAVAART